MKKNAETMRTVGAILAIAGLMLVGAGRAAAETWSLVADWSDLTTSFHNWEIGTKSDPGVTPTFSPSGPFSAWPMNDPDLLSFVWTSPPQKAWVILDDDIPFFLKQSSTVSGSNPDGYVGDLLGHTRSTAIPTMIWTAPRAMTIDISGSAWDADTRSPRAVAIALDVKGVNVFGIELAENPATSSISQESFATAAGGNAGMLSNVSVLPGDTVELRIPWTGSQGWVGIGEFLIDEVQVIPEPASLVLVGLGGLVLLRWRRA